MRLWMSYNNQYLWGCKLPCEETSRYIWMCVHWPWPKYGYHSPDTRWKHYLQSGLIGRQLTESLLSTILPNIDEWMAITWWYITTCKMASTWAIMVQLPLDHMIGRWWACQLILYPWTTCLVCHHLNILLTSKQHTPRSLINHVSLI